MWEGFQQTDMQMQTMDVSFKNKLCLAMFSEKLKNIEEK